MSEGPVIKIGFKLLKLLVVLLVLAIATLIIYGTLSILLLHLKAPQWIYSLSLVLTVLICSYVINRYYIKTKKQAESTPHLNKKTILYQDFQSGN